ncbi:T-cell receptor alpha chain V region PHDS58 [Lemmus lemmus]
MLPDTCSVLVLLLMLRDSRAQSMTHSDTSVTVSEESSLQLRCNYSSSMAPYLLWYVQYPGQGLQLLLRANEKGSSRGFEATYDKGSSSFHLQKTSVQESDSAVYYCAVGDTVTETTMGAEHKLITRGLTAEFLLL